MQALTENVAEIQLSYHPISRLGPVITKFQYAYTKLRNYFFEETLALKEQFIVLYRNRPNRVIGAFD
jgi:hypothetical protein